MHRKVVRCKGVNFFPCIQENTTKLKAKMHFYPRDLTCRQSHGKRTCCQAAWVNFNRFGHLITCTEAEKTFVIPISHLMSEPLSLALWCIQGRRQGQKHKWHFHLSPQNLFDTRWNTRFIIFYIETPPHTHTPPPQQSWIYGSSLDVSCLDKRLHHRDVGFIDGQRLITAGRVKAWTPQSLHPLWPSSASWSWH